jgi:predicted nucleic-acid-binding protein
VIAVDTNVLVRLLVNDSADQAQIEVAKNLLRAAGQVYVPQIVQVEMVWVLETAYYFDKKAILQVLQHLSEHPCFILQHLELFIIATNDYHHSHADFSDCLILAESCHQAYQLATFDRKLGKLHDVRWLTLNEISPI